MNKVEEYKARAKKLYEQQESNKPRRKGKRLPFHIIVEIMKQSNEGGRGTCEVCGTTYSMKFIQHVKIDSFHTGLACRVCVKKHHLQKLY